MTESPPNGRKTRAASGAPHGRRRPPAPEGRSRRRDRGQAAIEYLGFLPILLVVGLAGLQLGIAAYAAQQAGTAARAAARAESSDAEDRPTAETAGKAAVSGWIADGTRIEPSTGGGEVTVTAVVTIPSVVPFVDDFGTVRKTATMPMPDEEDLP
ncbi:TadE/TadG family type IV pilus assembly protein [Streptomyces sp. NPDC057494]|uniref:TadE/TadG family type IV pilus assembly protein n=1 Tax=Streptomyces sp. NPDC057494 TaxID=3346148 RepID=UPI0036A01710